MTHACSDVRIRLEFGGRIVSGKFLFYCVDWSKVKPTFNLAQILAKLNQKSFYFATTNSKKRTNSSKTNSTYWLTFWSCPLQDFKRLGNNERKKKVFIIVRSKLPLEKWKTAKKKKVSFLHVFACTLFKLTLTFKSHLEGLNNNISCR